MIKNIIFDVGNVLLGFDPEKYMEERNYTEDEKQILRNNMFHHPLWLDADRGVVEGEALRYGFVKNDPNHEDLILEAFDHVEQTLWEYEYSVRWVKQLKEKGYRLYVLSNYGKDLYERTKHMMNFLPFMEGVVFSYECHLLKPENEIYQFICEKYDLIPSECVFLDDRRENVEGAIRYGIQGIQFVDYETTSQKLFEVLNK